MSATRHPFNGLFLSDTTLAGMSYLYPQRHYQGFTAIELMVVISIMAIVTALAAPSFTGLMERWRAMQTFDGLQSTLYFARSEAIRRGGHITLRKEATGINDCNLANDSDEWDCGWYVFSDANANGNFNNGDTRLQGFLTPRNIQVTRSESGASIAFDRWGMPDAPFGFTIVPQGKNLSDPAAIGLCMSRGGRVRKVQTADLPC
ncbi:GspH/FimT family pseudopilin [Comamonas testosteroni]